MVMTKTLLLKKETNRQNKTCHLLSEYISLPTSSLILIDNNAFLDDVQNMEKNVQHSQLGVAA